MLKTLTITSPPMRGPEVTYAQKNLTEFGAWVGAVDGLYGETTGRAASQAKYMLGYATRNISPTYGNTLDKFLTGKAKPTIAMQLRARKRKNNKSLANGVIATARQYLGVKESPAGSNRVMFSEWYGIIGPWCAMFVTYCFVTAGSKAFEKGNRYAYCPFILDDARHQKNGLNVVPKDSASRGDIVLFDWNRDGVADHVGIVLTSVDASGNFTSIEGNAGAGEVAIAQHNVSDVIAFVRVSK